MPKIPLNFVVYKDINDGVNEVELTNEEAESIIEDLQSQLDKPAPITDLDLAKGPYKNTRSGLRYITKQLGDHQLEQKVDIDITLSVPIQSNVNGHHHAALAFYAREIWYYIVWQTAPYPSPQSPCEKYPKVFKSDRLALDLNQAILTKAQELENETV